MHYFKVLKFIFTELASENSTEEQINNVLLKTYGEDMTNRIWFQYKRIMGEYDDLRR